MLSLLLLPILCLILPATSLVNITIGFVLLEFPFFHLTREWPVSGKRSSMNPFKKEQRLYCIHPSLALLINRYCFNLSTEKTIS